MESRMSVSASEFAEYVEKYSGNIFTLCRLLLGQGSEAEEAAVKSFTELYIPYLRKGCDPQSFSLLAYRECIRHCFRIAQGRKASSTACLSWEDQLVHALRYGLRLPLAEISPILMKSMPELKAQLRQMRELLAGHEAALPKSSLSAG
ncbi:hypothetical protein A3844_09360 [Paenibacillus helianthi]|uniref:RNA polymerase sigma-70 region 2 domain-containing protein n=1 Tax=Paenibacillus helianthi TaxID=1349432 RepID=A0ABX3ERD6_9BACL|nr:hypothetical protein [Paenibacillus helianthi]OKP88006.1 hypothetical protein A3844_09360 [Paenibacillus helianthi]